MQGIRIRQVATWYPSADPPYPRVPGIDCAILIPVGFNCNPFHLAITVGRAVSLGAHVVAVVRGTRPPVVVYSDSVLHPIGNELII